MKVERKWNHDELTTALTEAVFSALHRDEDFKSFEVYGKEVYTKVNPPFEDDDSSVKIVVGDRRSTRRFELRFVEEL